MNYLNFRIYAAVSWAAICTFTVCVLMCEYGSVCIANCCMIYSLILWCCCLGLFLCHANAQRSLCNCSGPLKTPTIWTPAALDLCLSIRQLLLIAQSQDSVLWLHTEWFLPRLNTLICNKIWDLTNPWPWDWPDNAELDWKQVVCRL